MDFNLEKTFQDADKAANDAGDMARCPLVLTLDKKRTAAAYLTPKKDFVALYDTRSIFPRFPWFYAPRSGPKAAAVAYISGEPVALILPIRPTRTQPAPSRPISPRPPRRDQRGPNSSAPRSPACKTS